MDSPPSAQGFIETATGMTIVFPLPEPIFDLAGPGRPFGGGINLNGDVAIENQFRADDGTITTIDLGTCASVTAWAINDNGIVTGSCTLGGKSFGFLWRK